MAYDSARAVFRAAIPRKVGALIFEIARSEIGYTDQRPLEYFTSVMAAAIKEGYQGPLFVQGDHFQVSGKKFKDQPDEEIKAIEQLIQEAIQAGFYNIDIDTSTLVDLSQVHDRGPAAGQLRAVRSFHRLYPKAPAGRHHRLRRRRDR